MKSKVKIIRNTPKDAPKAQPFAQIDDQGRIPYASETPTEAPMAGDVKVMKARGMGAAKRGGNFKGC
jgi:hypothetical protein